jgi:acyl-CoA synthetase (AMP-forming)/AMP-acid ligase II
VWHYTEIRTVPDIVRHYGRTTPDKTAAIQGTRKVGYAQLDTLSSRLANAMVDRGIVPGSVIGYIGKNSISFFEILYAAGKAGCTMLPMNWRLVASELGPILKDAQPVVVFVDKDSSALMASVVQAHDLRCELVDIDTGNEYDEGLARWAGASPGSDPLVAIDPRSIALLMYTSGTTGKAKGVQLSHQALNYMRLCESLEPELQWRSNDILMMVMPNFHLLGTGIPIQQMYNGGTVSVLTVFEPGRLLALVQRDRPSVLVLAPTALQIVLDHPAAGETDFGSLRLVMYAGSPISATLLKRALVAMTCQFMQFYGATETGGATTILRPAQHDVNDERKLKSCGKPLPLIEVEVVDGDGHPLPDGQIGEFLIRAPSMFSGYRNQPDATAAALKDGWYRSGDAGYRDADGLLYIVDRTKDMIVSGGENIYSAEVEQAVSSHPAVAMAAVVGAPDPRWGERVTAIVVLKEDSHATQDDILQHCRGLIASYKVPKEVRFVQSMPISATGKVLKRVLRDQFWKDKERAVG